MVSKQGGGVVSIVEIISLSDDLMEPGPILGVHATAMGDVLGSFVVLRNIDGSVEIHLMVDLAQFKVADALRHCLVRRELKAFVESYLDECGAES